MFMSITFPPTVMTTCSSFEGSNPHNGLFETSYVPNTQRQSLVDKLGSQPCTSPLTFTKYMDNLGRVLEVQSTVLSSNSVYFKPWQGDFEWTFESREIGGYH